MLCAVQLQEQHSNPFLIGSHACGTAQLRRCLRQKQPKRSRGSGLLFASGPRPAQQKQGTATKAGAAVRPRLRGTSPAAALGYKNPQEAIRTHVDDEDKTTTLIQGDGSNYKSKTTINESGLYSLVLPVRPSPARRGASAPRRAVLPRTRGMQSYALLARPAP